MYVDGFLLAVKSDRRDDYAKLAAEAAEVFVEHGAVRVVECWADDVAVGELTSFPRAVKKEDDETVVFAWIEYPDKETRDACVAKTFTDPRMQGSMDTMPFDGKRMIFGGFQSMLEHTA